MEKLKTENRERLAELKAMKKSNHTKTLVFHRDYAKRVYEIENNQIHSKDNVQFVNKKKTKKQEGTLGIGQVMMLRRRTTNLRKNFRKKKKLKKKSNETR